MKYTTSVEIKKPLDEVIKLFDNPDNLSKWMDGLQSFEHISGEPGKPGAQSRLKFKMGKREMEMIETVSVRNLPEEFSGTYEANGVLNIQKNSFVKIDDNITRYIAENEFKFNGFLMKIMGFIMPGAFKKQSLKFMNSFKEFAESQ